MPTPRSSTAAMQSARSSRTELVATAKRVPKTESVTSRAYSPCESRRLKRTRTDTGELWYELISRWRLPFAESTTRCSGVNSSASPAAA